MRNEVKLANPNYDSSKIEEFKNVWVFCEQRQGQMMSTSYELISEGRKLADELGVKLCGLLVGDNVGDLAESIGGYGADEVIVCDHPLLKNYTTDAYAKVICDVISEMKPEAFLIGATNIGRDLGPRCAARLHTGLCADCTHLDVDMPIYKDFLRGASTLPEAKIDGMATAKVKAVKVTKYDVKLDAADLQTEVVEVVKAAKKLVDLVGADYIVSVGRGISKDVEGGIKLAHELADVLGGVVGGSRVAIDSGWLTADHQVGQTGKTVHPKVYVALGISGSIQHKAGMSESECIIAVNKNETAPIFEIADYGICGDLFKVTPMLIEAFKAAKASK